MGGVVDHRLVLKLIGLYPACRIEPSPPGRGRASLWHLRTAAPGKPRGRFRSVDQTDKDGPYGAVETFRSD
jgi:hypothetical protein